MKIFSSKRRVLALVALFVLLLFVLRPGASRLKSRIVTSISSAVGRPVEVGSVQIRLLPRPGFELHDLVVYDDPAFGAEPMLRASEVSAALRVTSLFRGRLEIARLNLTDPSLNLVHAPQGGWNLEALVERSAHKSLAPTGKAKSEPRPGFPYIEGTSARINFKNGPEKKPYALTNADFALWQDSENTWGVRLKAQPFRGDFNLNDTGMLQVNGTWQRAEFLRDTPLQISAEWSSAQLGQLSKFFTGNDRGWRGAVQLDVTLTGTPANLKVASTVSVQDFRRYDIVSGNALKLAAHCDGQYSSLDHTFRGLDCVAPVGNGRVALKGDMGIPGSRTFDLELTAEDVPASAAVALVQRAKKNLPDDLATGGIIHGRLSWREDAVVPSRHRFDGRGEIEGLRLASVVNKTEFGPQSIPFVLRADDVAPKGVARNVSAAATVLAEGPHVEFGPFPVAVGHAVTARGWVMPAGYNILLAGDADIAKTLRLARIFGLPALQTTAEGVATVDLRVAGSWSGWSYGSGPGFPGAQVTGTAKLRNVRVALRGTGAPVEIVSGELQLLPDTARVEKLNAKALDAHWTGSLELPRGCGTPDACVTQFNLSANAISVQELAKWLNPHPAERPWYRALETGSPTEMSFPNTLRAAGRVHLDRFEMQHGAATNFSANLSFDHGKIELAKLSGDLLGGKLDGDWQADASVKPALCSESGKLNAVSLTRLSDTMKNEHFSGTASVTYEIKGPCGAEFWSAAEGDVSFNAINAALTGISLADGSTPLRVALLTGQARLQEGKFVIDHAKVDSDSGKFQLDGTAALNGALELKLTRPANTSGSAFTITGTLAAPQVKPVAGVEQARLKTEPSK